MKTIIIGLGNTVLTDDAVGPAVAERVQELLGKDVSASSDVDVRVLGVGGLHLLEALDGYDRAIIIDAMLTGVHAPGTVREVALPEGTRNLACTHDAGLGLALETSHALGIALPRILTLIGIEAADVSTFSMSMTPAVEAASRRAAQMVFEMVVCQPVEGGV